MDDVDPQECEPTHHQHLQPQTTTQNQEENPLHKQVAGFKKEATGIEDCKQIQSLDNATHLKVAQEEHDGSLKINNKP